MKLKKIISLFVCLLFAIPFVVNADEYVDDSSYYKLYKGNAYLFQSDSLDSDKVDGVSIDVTTVLTGIQSNSDWAKVTTEDGIEGWLYINYSGNGYNGPYEDGTIVVKESNKMIYTYGDLNTFSSDYIGSGESLESGSNSKVILSTGSIVSVLEEFGPYYLINYNGSYYWLDKEENNDFGEIENGQCIKINKYINGSKTVFNFSNDVKIPVDSVIEIVSVINCNGYDYTLVAYNDEFYWTRMEESEYEVVDSCIHAMILPSVDEIEEEEDDTSDDSSGMSVKTKILLGVLLAGIVIITVVIISQVTKEKTDVKDLTLDNIEEEYKKINGDDNK